MPPSVFVVPSEPGNISVLPNRPDEVKITKTCQKIEERPRYILVVAAASILTICIAADQDLSIRTTRHAHARLGRAVASVLLFVVAAEAPHRIVAIFLILRCLLDAVQYHTENILVRALSAIESKLAVCAGNPIVQVAPPVAGEVCSSS